MLVGESQPFGIADRKRTPLQQAFGLGELAAFANHFRRNVGNRHAHVWPTGTCNPQRDITGTAGDIKEMKTLSTARWIERDDEIVFPQAMQSHRHQVVHLVVALSDFGKDLVHEALFLLLANAAKAESNVVICLELYHGTTLALKV